MSHHDLEKCPICDSPIGEENKIESTLICRCGWTRTLSSASQTWELRSDRKVVRHIAVVGVLLAMAFVHIAHWDQFSMEVIPLKVRYWSYTADVKDLGRMVEICNERGKPSCTENVHSRLASMEPTELAHQQNLGLIQMEMKKWNDATESFRVYFEKGGKDSTVAYNYAQVLFKVGEVETAEQYFKYAIQTKPGQLQPKVMRSYVDMLIASNDLQKAKKLIYKFRRKNKKAAYFLENQLSDIKRRLKVAKL